MSSKFFWMSEQLIFPCLSHSLHCLNIWVFSFSFSHTTPLYCAWIVQSVYFTCEFKISLCERWGINVQTKFLLLGNRSYKSVQSWNKYPFVCFWTVNSLRFGRKTEEDSVNKHMIGLSLHRYRNHRRRRYYHHLLPSSSSFASLVIQNKYLPVLTN